MDNDEKKVEDVTENLVLDDDCQEPQDNDQGQTGESVEETAAASDDVEETTAADDTDIEETASSEDKDAEDAEDAAMDDSDAEETTPAEDEDTEEIASSAEDDDTQEAATDEDDVGEETVAADYYDTDGDGEDTASEDAEGGGEDAESETGKKARVKLVDPADSRRLPFSLIAALIGAVLTFLPIALFAYLIFAYNIIFYPIFIATPLLIYLFNRILKGARDIRGLIINIVFTLISTYVFAVALSLSLLAHEINELYGAFGYSVSFLEIPIATVQVLLMPRFLLDTPSAYVYPLLFTTLGVTIAWELMRGKRGVSKAGGVPEVEAEDSDSADENADVTDSGEIDDEALPVPDPEDSDTTDDDESGDEETDAVPESGDEGTKDADENAEDAGEDDEGAGEDAKDADEDAGDADENAGDAAE